MSATRKKAADLAKGDPSLGGNAQGGASVIARKNRANTGAARVANLNRPEPMTLAA
jgi:hypothetical protein